MVLCIVVVVIVLCCRGIEGCIVCDISIIVVRFIVRFVFMLMVIWFGCMCRENIVS